MSRPVLHILLTLIGSLAAVQCISGGTDSLEQVLANETADTLKIELMLNIARQNMLPNTQKAEEMAQKAIELSHKKGLKADEAAGWRVLGGIYYYRDQYNTAMEHYYRSLAIAAELKDEKGTGSQLRNIALCYTGMGSNAKAIDFYYRALRIAERCKDTVTISNLMNDIGGVFYQQGDMEKAREYYGRTIVLHKATGNKKGEATALNNIGSASSMMKEYSFALAYFMKAFEIREKIADTAGLITCYTNIAQIYSMRGEHEKALENNFKALRLAEAIRYDRGLANVYSALANVFKPMKNYSKAAEYGNKSLALAEKHNDQDRKLEIHHTLFEIYDGMNKPGIALRHYKEYLRYRDSLLNQNNSKKTLQLQMQYEFDKKQLADSIREMEHAKMMELRHQEEIGQQKTYMYGGMLGFMLMIVISGMLYKAYRQKRKDAELIAEQKALAEEKQKEILDSIYYAKRIQMSLLPSPRYIEKNLERLQKN